MSYSAVLHALGPPSGGKPTKTIKFTIPEGFSRKQIALLVKRSGIRGNYLAATADQKFLKRAQAMGLSRKSRTLEGFLFPSTYDLPAQATVDDLVDRQLDAFERVFKSLNMRTAHKRNLTTYDVVKIASMIEREGQRDKERSLISAVIYNRLHRKMPLGIDATTRYELNNWTRPLRDSDFANASPYNTRRRVGLPPTPIGNPGRPSLQAATAPAHVGYLFYVVKPGPCGEHAFSTSDQQFQRDVMRYKSERAARGGRSPTACSR